jgi:hypothetical protein
MLLASGVHAESVKLTAWEHFEAQKTIILKDIKDDVIYREIRYSDVKMVKDTLERMSAMLEEVNHVEELDEQAKVELHNEQELVNTILTMAENDSRTVCRRRGRLGTNFKTTICETVAERRERQEADRAAIDKLLKSDIKTPINPQIGG